MPLQYYRKASGFVMRHCVTGCVAFSVVQACLPASLLAIEKPLPDTKKPKSAATKEAESYLANAELMIEQLVMQVDGQDYDNLEGKELADNPNPTSLVSSIPNIKPVSGSISSNFGIRVHPIYNTSFFHQGIDIAVPEGTGVQTTGDGIVAYAGYEKGYGQVITINHGFGYKTVYAHLSKPLVRQGQKVSRGDIIALSGNTGVSTGPHLHYEVQKDNARVNPAIYFFNDTNPDKFITIQHGSPEQSDNHS